MIRCWPVKTLVPQLSSLLIHRYPVSGTAKGKGKTKDGQALKRSTIRRKKPPAAAAAASSPGGGPRTAATERLNALASACLHAPTPIRRLSPKQRLREEARERLGLVSKDRQREKDAAKKPVEEEAEAVLMGPPGLDFITLGLVDADQIPKYELTVEDGRRLAKEHSRVLMRLHRRRQAAETALLRLKKEAIAALPDNLRAAALVPDFTPFPANRFMATLTPPIEGYIDKVREAAKKFTAGGKDSFR